MARAKARVVLHGRFSPGAIVRLVRVRDESVLRPGAGDTVVGTQVVDEDGRVEFSSGVEDGARYFIVGQQDGQPLEVRARGRLPGDENEVFEVAPVGTEPRKFSGGGAVDAPADHVVAVAEAQVASGARDQAAAVRAANKEAK